MARCNSHRQRHAGLCREAVRKAEKPVPSFPFGSFSAHVTFAPAREKEKATRPWHARISTATKPSCPFTLIFLVMGDKLPERLTVYRTTERCSGVALFWSHHDARSNHVRHRHAQLAFLFQRANKRSVNAGLDLVQVDAHALALFFQRARHN